MGGGERTYLAYRRTGIKDIACFEAPPNGGLIYPTWVALSWIINIDIYSTREQRTCMIYAICGLSIVSLVIYQGTRFARFSMLLAPPTTRDGLNMISQTVLQHVIIQHAQRYIYGVCGNVNMSQRFLLTPRAWISLHTVNRHRRWSPELLGHAVACRWHSLSRVCRDKASSTQGSSRISCCAPLPLDSLLY